jgi:glutamine amidotransferase-like uncharacterized protein
MNDNIRIAESFMSDKGYSESTLEKQQEFARKRNYPLKRVALFLRHPECSKDCVYAIVHALSEEYQIRIFEESELDDPDFFFDLDVIVFPGGIGDSDTYLNFFTRTRANRIADFIQRGGHYLGICMGAYWAGSRYFDLLINADTTQYIKRPNADVKRSYGTVADVTWKGAPEKMYFYDGCSILGEENDFKVIARYANNDPMAIIQGRIGLIGCHPEAPKYWFEKPWQYIEKDWNDGRHHKLLLDFVNELTERK